MAACSYQWDFCLTWDDTPSAKEAGASVTQTLTHKTNKLSPCM